MLTTEALAIEAELEAGNLDAARAALPALVGRDPSELGEDEIARAVVESVAENTVDAVVAPVVWAAVGGGVGALVYRAVNTMDSMVGHHGERYERFGWAAARLDDVVNWVPARLAAAIVALLRPSRAGEVWRAVREDAPGTPLAQRRRRRGRLRRRARCEAGRHEPLRPTDRAAGRARTGTPTHTGRHRGVGAALPATQRGAHRGTGGRGRRACGDAAAQGAVKVQG
jgi:adenosylcobinamide-phosphate synthase